MKVSIITATYNSEKTVSDTLQSVALQSYTNIEHLIIDGNSTDGTLELVQEFPHITNIVSEPDKGIYDAMNKGIALATGDLIGILNSDDFYTNSEVIEKVVKTITTSDAESLYGDLHYVSADNTNKVVRNWRSGPFNRDKFKWGWMPPHPTFFVKKKVYQQYGNFNLDFVSAADYELMLRMLYKRKLSTIYLPEVLVKMRTGGKSNANLKNRVTANQEDKKAWEVNKLKPLPFTFLLKPLRKITQFI